MQFVLIQTDPAKYFTPFFALTRTFRSLRRKRFSKLSHDGAVQIMVHIGFAAMRGFSQRC